jgi:hypothetical protein
MSKLDYTFKKISNRLYTIPDKSLGNELARSSVLLHNQTVLLQEIPKIPVENEYIKKYTRELLKVPGFLLEGALCYGILDNEKNNLLNFIPPMYGDNYSCIFECSLSGSSLFDSYYQIGAESESNWIFDYETGLLTLEKDINWKEFFKYYYNLDDPEELEFFEDDYQCSADDIEITNYYITAYRYIGKNMDQQIVYDDTFKTLNVIPTKTI